MKYKWKMFFLCCYSFIVATVILVGIYSFYFGHQIPIRLKNASPNVSKKKVKEIQREEKDFPLAYSLIIYRDMDQVKRLLWAIYRPYNFYCIHIDRRSKPMNLVFVRNLTQTYKNIIMPEYLIPVFWGTFSVLEADLLCMKALLKLSKKWKYFINLTGQEWPLKTNLELVRIFKVLNGSNMISKIKTLPGRILNNEIVPFNIHLWHGDVHIVACRGYVEFLLYDVRVKKLTIYLQNNTFIPDELLFSSVSHSHKLRPPGGYSGYLLQDNYHYPMLTRYKLWLGTPCHGQWQRSICIFGLKDIPAMISTSVMQLFANKFVNGMNNVVLNFMEDWFYKRSKLVYMYPDLNPFIDLDYYSRLPQVKEHW